MVLVGVAKLTYASHYLLFFASIQESPIQQHKGLEIITVYKVTLHAVRQTSKAKKENARKAS